MSTPSEAKPSILHPDNFKRVAKTKMAWQILILFAAVFLVLIAVLRNNVNSNYAYMGALLITGVGMLYLYKKKNPDVLFTFAAISGSTLAQISTWLVLEASHYANFLWIVICSIIVYLGAYRRVGNIILFFNALGVGYFIYYVINEQIAFARPLTNLELTSLYLELLLGFVVLGYFMYQFVSFQKMWEKAYIDINHSLENQNATIKKQNQENITLLKEIHHRVKNNLQIIISLLRLQKNELKHEESRVQFQEAINRIMVMSSIHQKLYQQEKLSEIDVNTYLQELINDLTRLYESQKQGTVDLNCSLDAVNIKTIVTVGLLMNELIANSIKYAFKHSNEGSINIGIAPVEDNFKLTYSDNGKWQENSGDDGFGMELINIFTEQLNGEKELKKGENGSTYRFNLKFAQ